MSPYDALSVCAEVAIAILGFSGVVVVLGGRPQESSNQEMFRVLFRGTLMPLAVIALAFIFEAASADASTSWRICSTVQAITMSIFLFGGVRTLRRDPARPFLPMLGGAFLVFGLSVLNALTLHAFWPVLTAICWGLTISVFAFANLIFSRLGD